MNIMWRLMMVDQHTTTGLQLALVIFKKELFVYLRILPEGFLYNIPNHLLLYGTPDRWTLSKLTIY